MKDTLEIFPQCYEYEEKIQKLLDYKRFEIKGFPPSDLGDILERLKNHQNITSLDLRLNVYDGGCKSSLTEENILKLVDLIKENQKLKHLYLWSNSLNADSAINLAEAIKGHNSLTHVNISGNPLGDKGADAFIKMLGFNNHLEYLCLDRNGITSEGFKSLPLALKANKSLKTLELNKNALDDQAIKIIGQALTETTCLNSISLEDCNIKEPEVKLLAEALKLNNSLEDFRILKCEINEDTAQVISDMLKVNDTLQVLKFENVTFNGEALDIILTGLKQNASINHVKFKGGNIPETGIRLLANVLHENSNIMILSIEQNQVTEKGAKALAEVIETRSSLQHLMLYQCSIAGKGAVAIAEALKENISISSLNWFFTDLNSTSIKAFKDTLKHNPYLEIFLMDDELDKDTEFKNLLEKNYLLVKEINEAISTAVESYHKESIKLMPEQAQLLKKHARYVAIRVKQQPDLLSYTDQEHNKHLLKLEEIPAIYEFNKEPMDKLAKMLSHYFGNISNKSEKLEAQELNPSVEFEQEFYDLFKAQAAKGHKLLNTVLDDEFHPTNSLEIVKEFFSLPYEVILEYVAPVMDKEMLERLKSYTSELLVSYDLKEAALNFINSWEIEEAIAGKEEVEESNFSNPTEVLADLDEVEISILGSDED